MEWFVEASFLCTGTHLLLQRIVRLEHRPRPRWAGCSGLLHACNEPFQRTGIRRIVCKVVLLSWIFLQLDSKLQLMSPLLLPGTEALDDREKQQRSSGSGGGGGGSGVPATYDHVVQAPWIAVVLCRRALPPTSPYSTRPCVISTRLKRAAVVSLRVVRAELDRARSRSREWHDISGPRAAGQRLVIPEPDRVAKRCN